jgi:hypothetical protein
MTEFARKLKTATIYVSGRPLEGIEAVYAYFDAKERWDRQYIRKAIELERPYRNSTMSLFPPQVERVKREDPLGMGGMLLRGHCTHGLGVLRR